ncbi:uncharacterized protein A4U43_C05F21610 [Asparagus officinalis]|uniref:Uncharacterized protein n=1 Tax=Asparagus officinalis TaxID=4686 RepID=A0A5P1EXH6_ASPOF|nr:uncharacterized protein A4U43_C05F21610 [Asparagus officinalis]
MSFEIRVFTTTAIAPPTTASIAHHPTDEEEEALASTAASPASTGPEIAFRRGADVTGGGAVATWIPMRLRGGCPASIRVSGRGFTGQDP